MSVWRSKDKSRGITSKFNVPRNCKIFDMNMLLLDCESIREIELLFIFDKTLLRVSLMRGMPLSSLSAVLLSEKNMSIENMPCSDARNAELS
jgi:hypothetical protein